MCMLTGRDDQQARPMHPVVAAAMRRDIPADVVTPPTSSSQPTGGGRRGSQAGLERRSLPSRISFAAGTADSAAELLGDALRHDALPAGSEDSYLPEVREVARSTAAPAAGAALALVTQSADQAAARRLLEDSLASAESAGDYPLAWVVAGHLADALRGSAAPGPGP